ncbi:MAG: PilZ domain-containing protein [Erythrobacter sp.]
MMTKTMPAGERDSGAEKRAMRRSSQLLRSAKVVCETGEYVCLIRDISEIGVGLSFLHEAPPEARIILQLTNGLTYPLERVWAGKTQTGYRFGSAISVAEFLGEESPFERRPVRLEIHANARITDGRQITKVQLVDISREGCKFASDGNHPEKRLLSFEALGLPQRLGQIRWQNGRNFGMQFQHPLAIEDLASTALRLQPYASDTIEILGDGETKVRAA